MTDAEKKQFIELYGKYRYEQCQERGKAIYDEITPPTDPADRGGPGSPECIAACIVKGLTEQDVADAELNLAAAQYADQLAANQKAVACSV